MRDSGGVVDGDECSAPRWRRHKNKAKGKDLAGSIQKAFSTPPFVATLDGPCGTMSHQNHRLVSKTGLECDSKVNSALVLQKGGVK